MNRLCTLICNFYNVSCEDLKSPLPKQTSETFLAANCGELLQGFKKLTFKGEESLER